MTAHIRIRAGALVIKDDSILLIEYVDENGLHYNLPGGGVEPGEGAKEAVKRELKEEACALVKVGELAYVYEYIPHLSSDRYGKTPSLTLIFSCELEEESGAKMPRMPDANQTAVKWISLSELKEIVLFPKVNQLIYDYLKQSNPLSYIEDHSIK